MVAGIMVQPDIAANWINPASEILTSTKCSLCKFGIRVNTDQPSIGSRVSATSPSTGRHPFARKCEVGGLSSTQQRKPMPYDTGFALGIAQDCNGVTSVTDARAHDSLTSK